MPDIIPAPVVKAAATIEHLSCREREREEKRSGGMRRGKKGKGERGEVTLLYY
jgi:hypothetical protein